MSKRFLKLYLLFILIIITNLVWAQPQLRNIEDVIKAGSPVISEISSSDASLNFTSNVALACTIVFGETNNFGRISNDPDMSSTVTTKHRPILTGLKPDTLYYYRVQGVAENGTIYWGPNLSFTTASVQKSSSLNVAALKNGGHILSVSSNWGGAANNQAWGANGALDENRSSAWSSNGDADGGFLEIGFRKSYDLEAIEVWTRTMSNGTAQIFEFWVEDENGKKFGPFILPDANRSYRFNLNSTTQSLNFTISKSSGGNTGLVEFKAFAKP